MTEQAGVEPITDEQTRIEAALWEAIYPDPEQRPAEGLRAPLLAPVMAVVAPLVARAEDAERRIQAVRDLCADAERYVEEDGDPGLRRRGALIPPSDLLRALDGEGTQR